MNSAAKKLFSTKSLVGISVYEGKSSSYDNIRSDLLQNLGGNVELNLDEKSGIASMCLNNPSKRNAMTGEYRIVPTHIILFIYKM